MATGDVQNNTGRMTQAYRRLGYHGEIDLQMVAAGQPQAFLPLLHHALLCFSRELAQTLVSRGHKLFGKTDLRFVEAAYKALRDEYAYVPRITKEQFFNAGFAEQKILFLTDVARLCEAKHAELVRRKPSRQRQSLETSPTLHSNTQPEQHQSRKRVSSSSAASPAPAPAQTDRPTSGVVRNLLPAANTSAAFPVFPGHPSSSSIVAPGASRRSAPVHTTQSPRSDAPASALISRANISNDYNTGSPRINGNAHAIPATTSGGFFEPALDLSCSDGENDDDEAQIETIYAADADEILWTGDQDPPPEEALSDNEVDSITSRTATVSASAAVPRHSSISSSNSDVSLSSVRRNGANRQAVPDHLLDTTSNKIAALTTSLQAMESRIARLDTGSNPAATPHTRHHHQPSDNGWSSGEDSGLLQAQRSKKPQRRYAGAAAVVDEDDGLGRRRSDSGTVTSPLASAAPSIQQQQPSDSALLAGLPPSLAPVMEEVFARLARMELRIDALVQTSSTLASKVLLLEASAAVATPPQAATTIQSLAAKRG
eukprot:m.29168 g.29168  ORF g.29168 m.29168 type:complete len:543 (-) comp10393_c0_seq2:154-1782(-)